MQLTPDSRRPVAMPIVSTSAPNKSAMPSNRIRRGLIDGCFDMAVAGQATVRATDQRSRHVVPMVQQAVAHARAEVHERAVEQRTVAVRRVLQLLDELGELHHLIRRDARVLLDALRRVLVVRRSVMRLFDADVHVAPAAALVAEHQAEDARDVALERDMEQVVHDGHVIVEVLGDTDRTIRALVSALERACIFCSWSSTRRMFVRYSSRIALSFAPITFCNRDVSCMTESSMLFFACRRTDAARAFLGHRTCAPT